MNSAGKGSGRRKHIASGLGLHRRVRLEGDLGALCHANGEALLIVMGCKGNLWYIDRSARDSRVEVFSPGSGMLESMRDEHPTALVARKQMRNVPYRVMV